MIELEGIESKLLIIRSIKTQSYWGFLSTSSDKDTTTGNVNPSQALA
jgi:hypothetical protein